MSLSLDEIELPLDGLPTSAATAAGQPAQLPVDLVEEDPDQPRTEFGDKAFKELCDSIAERGVITPLSVRAHPTTPGRWIINHGARRWRASRQLGLATVPAFVDKPADGYEQVIENEKREPLSAMDLALFIKKRMATGESQTEIARQLGKSRQYVSMATALIDPPAWLEQAYRDGKCRGILELYELRRMEQTMPEEIADWVNKQDTIGRIAVQRFKGSHDSAQNPTAGRAPGEGRSEQVMSDGAIETRRKPKPRGPEARVTRPKLLAQLDGETVEIDCRKVPSLQQQVLVMRAGATESAAVEAAQLRLIGWSTADDEGPAA